MRSSLRLIRFGLITMVAGSALWACGDGSFLNGRNSGAAGTGDPNIDVGDQTEQCNNGLNEDGDDLVDENCTCDVGAVQNCFPGPPGNAGVGSCQWGTQTCYEVTPTEVETHGEWGPCEGAVLPQNEQCGDGEDSDCNGANDCDECDSGGPCPPPSSSGDNNTSGSGSGDNNTSGSGSGDNNTSGAGAGSGSGDNNTTSGAGAGSGSGDNNTTSGAGASSGSGDNNTTSGAGASSGSGDNNTTSGAGASSGSGDNNTSGVGAGSTSSGGGDGCICKPGTIRWCDTPVGCMWGKQVCAPDSTWGTCVETNQRPPGCDGYDFYDPGCCILAPNACCQNPFTDVSMGDCQQQLDCY